MRSARMALALLLTMTACRGADSQSGVAIIDCVNGYGDAIVPQGSSIVLGAVALPTEGALAAVANDRGLWSKQPLVVRSDKAVELRVADEWRGRFEFNWGQPAQRHVDRIRVPSCAATRNPQWLAFTGGYYATEPGCVALIVRVGEVEQRVEIGLGAPCG